VDVGPEVLALLLPEVVLPAEVGHHLVDMGEVGEEVFGGHELGRDSIELLAWAHLREFLWVVRLYCRGGGWRGKLVGSLGERSSSIGMCL